tara:strand:- start:15 stop:767 length:753 start_codon:yes stop_codon:yes gene_type:complete
MTNIKMYFVANWKMHGNIKDIERSKSVLKLTNSKKFKNNKIIYCPPYTLLERFYEKVKFSKILIGAQNCHHNHDFGPFTGSINSKLIKSTGAKYVIIGHSENRLGGDTNLQINKKIKSALNENLKVIFCIGEKLLEKKKNLTYKILKKQITNGLKNIKNLKNIIIAYEPVWSIGTGLTPKKTELMQSIKKIKKILYSYKKIKNVKILYGGSVNPKNAKKFAEINELNGFIIGGASLKPKKFIDIIKKSIN